MFLPEGYYDTDSDAWSYRPKADSAVLEAEPKVPEKCYRCGKKPPPGRKSVVIEEMLVCELCDRPPMLTP